MITFKEHFNEGAEAKYYPESARDGYWINLKEEVKNVGYAGHYSHVVFNSEDFGMKPDVVRLISKKFRGEGVIAQAISNGGIRVSIVHGRMTIEANTPKAVDNKIIRPKIEEIGRRHRISGVWGYVGQPLSNPDAVKIMIDTRSYVPNLPQNQDTFFSNESWIKPPINQMMDGYWITPVGEIEQVGKYGHGQFVEDNPKLFKLHNIDLTGDENNMVARAIKNGGVHVSVIEPKMVIDVANDDQALSRKREINTIAIQHRIPLKWSWGKLDYTGSIQILTGRFTKYLT